MPHSRVYLEHSRTIFILKIEHSRQELQADEVLYKTSSSNISYKNAIFFHEIKRVEFRITISF
jgi:hypothetical protein